MAFRLDHDSSITRQVRRLARREMDAALEALAGDPPTDEDVFEARKSLKKVRALLRLLRKPLGKDYQRFDDRLQAAAHALSRLRDADVTVDTLGRLHALYPTVVTPSVWRRVSRGLRVRRRRTRRHTAPYVARARGALERTRRAVPQQLAQVARFRATRAGVVRGYRESRKAMTGLVLDSAAPDFHEWRKRVKRHGYHVRLFEGLDAGARRRRETLKRLEKLLGEEHDVAVLEHLLLQRPDRYGDAPTTALVLGGIAKAHASLRRRALALGHRTFAQAPGDFDDTIKHWWRNAQKRRTSW
jgi:CHAD domain-containing protein